ncbi:hypothetical protein V8C86DRAFT_859029 [Haematococcus lacustris]
MSQLTKSKGSCFASLWGDASLADTTLQLRVADASAGHLPVHRAVLAARSEYFKARLLRWGSSGSQDATKFQPSSAVSHFSKTGKLPPGLTTHQLAQVCKEAKAQDDLRCVEACSLAFPDIAMDEPGSSQAPLPCLEETFDSFTECGAARLVVRCMYEGQLAEEVKDSMTLARVCRVAERWAFTSLTSKCLLKLAGLPPSQLPAGQLVLVLQTLPDSCALLPVYEKWQERVHSLVLSHYGDVHAVITSAQLRDYFQQLPFAAVQLWAGSDKLTVDSENSVVELLSLWVSGPMGQACSVEQQQQLSCLVRVQHLSPAYATRRLSTLDWFSIPGIASQDVALAASCGHGMNGVLPKPPLAWSATPRKKLDTTELRRRTTIRWDVPRQQLVDLLASKDLTSDLCSEPVYSAGVGWRIYLDLQADQRTDGQPGFTLGCWGELVTYAGCKDHALGAKLPGGTPIKYVITRGAVLKSKSSLYQSSVIWMEDAYGEDDFLALSKPFETAAQLEPFLVSDCLQVTGTFEVVHRP